MHFDDLFHIRLMQVIQSNNCTVGLLKNAENNEHWLNFCRFPLSGTGTNRF